MILNEVSLVRPTSHSKARERLRHLCIRQKESKPGVESLAGLKLEPEGAQLNEQIDLISRPCPWCGTQVHQNRESLRKDPEEFFSNTDDLIFWSDGGITRNGVAQQGREFLWPQDRSYIASCPRCHACYVDSLIPWVNESAAIPTWRILQEVLPGEQVEASRDMPEPQELLVANFDQTVEFLGFHLAGTREIEWAQWTAIQQLFMEAGVSARSGKLVSSIQVEKAIALIPDFIYRLAQIIEGTIGSMSPKSRSYSNQMDRYYLEEIIPIVEIRRICGRLESGLDMVGAFSQILEGGADFFGVNQDQVPSGSKLLRSKAKAKLLMNLIENHDSRLIANSDGMPGFRLEDLGFDEEEEIAGEVTIREVIGSEWSDVFYPAVIMFVSRQTAKVAGIAMYSDNYAMLANRAVYTNDEDLVEFWHGATRDEISSFLNEDHELWVLRESEDESIMSAHVEEDDDKEISWEVTPVQWWARGVDIPVELVEKIGIYLGYGSGYAPEELLAAF